jgi:hypothetical protein
MAGMDHPSAILLFGITRRIGPGAGLHATDRCVYTPHV